MESVGRLSRSKVLLGKTNAGKLSDANVQTGVWSSDVCWTISVHRLVA